MNNNCQLLHDRHDRKTIKIELRGQPKIPDYPKIQDKFAMDFGIIIFDYEKYAGSYGAYCTGQDELSMSLDTQGIWEGFMTILVIDILKQKPGNVLDIGAHIGWYSIIAGKLGCKVQAIEGDGENAEVFAENMKTNKIRTAEVLHTFIRKDTKYYPDEGTHIRLLKSDLEGADNYAIEGCERLFEEKQIDFAIVEISPFLKKGIYPELVQKICNYGYKAYKMAEKGFEHMAEYEEEPLATTLKYCEVTDFSAIDELRQENFLFVRVK